MNHPRERVTVDEFVDNSKWGAGKLCWEKWILWYTKFELPDFEARKIFSEWPETSMYEGQDYGFFDFHWHQYLLGVKNILDILRSRLHSWYQVFHEYSVKCWWNSKRRQNTHHGCRRSIFETFSCPGLRSIFYMKINRPKVGRTFF